MQDNLIGKLTFNLYKFNQDKSEYNMVNITNDCHNDRLLNYSGIPEQYTIEYTWIKSSSTSTENIKHQKLVKPYNDSIINTRTSLGNISTLELLKTPVKLNDYQTKLNEMITKSHVKKDKGLLGFLNKII